MWQTVLSVQKVKQNKTTTISQAEKVTLCPHCPQGPIVVIPLHAANFEA